MYVPLHIFIRCILYYSFIPSSVVSLSVTSLTMLLSSLLISPLIELRLSKAMPLKIDPRAGAVAVGLEAVVAVGIIL